VNVLERAIRRVDAFQQSKVPLALVFGVIKKFGDDAAGSLAALLTYYGWPSPATSDSTSWPFGC
jgi:hypothetical protein